MLGSSMLRRVIQFRLQYLIFEEGTPQHLLPFCEAQFPNYSLSRLLSPNMYPPWPCSYPLMYGGRVRAMACVNPAQSQVSSPVLSPVSEMTVQLQLTVASTI